MTTNKPEVFEVYRTRQGTLENVVLLADYEALQAECEKLREFKAKIESQEPDCWRITHRSFCGIVTDKKEIAGDPPYSGCVFPLYANPVPADKPAVAAPENAGIIPMLNGKPQITNRMKAECIGEFSWQEEVLYYDEHGEMHDYVVTHAVPWGLCKEFYKRKASVAMLEAAPSHSQQSAEYRCHKCGAETPPPEPFKAYVKCTCGTITAATAALADDRCPSHESEQGGSNV